MSGKEHLEYERYFEAVLNQHQGAISRVVSSYELIKALQEELYQEISLALWKALSKFDHQSSLKTYILSIAHKRSISHVAKYAKIPRTTDIANVELTTDNCPSEQLAQSQRTQRLLNAVYHLSMFDRQLVTLALEGVSYKETGEILGISTNLVGVKLSRAKLKLKEIMTQVKS